MAWLAGPLAAASRHGNADDVSLVVQALGSGSLIVAERPMYFAYHHSQGGSDVLGYVGG